VAVAATATAEARRGGGVVVAALVGGAGDRAESEGPDGLEQVGDDGEAAAAR
jgi:hypothetical protein